MGRFSDKLRTLAGDSRFTHLELESILAPEEREILLEIKEVLVSATDYNEASARIQGMGEHGVTILTKIAKKALLG